MKLKSFGCSFIYGSDLSDQSSSSLKDNLEVSPSWPLGHGSELTWPALIAQRYDLAYECHAWPGIGNFQILCNIISQASLDDPAIFVINWSWIDRFDYFDHEENWCTLLPGDNQNLSKFYYKNLHSHMRDVLTSIYHVNAAIDFLSSRKLPFFMTYMDYNLLNPIDPNWQDPKYLQVVQKKISQHLVDFEGKNFLDWSQHNDFPISSKWHPLEQAHASAAEWVAPSIDAILHRA